MVKEKKICRGNNWGRFLNLVCFIYSSVLVVSAS